jgi:hypothetical protein
VSFELLPQPASNATTVAASRLVKVFLRSHQTPAPA